MGIYFNPDNEGFKKCSQGRIYMDKSMLIKEMNLVLNDTQNCVAISHARRFGKTQAAVMLKAYYSKGCDSRALFEKLEISNSQDWDKYLNKFNVIHLDMSTFAGNHKEDLIEYTTLRIFEDISQEYPTIKYTKDIADLLNKIYNVSKIKFVIIIDEWDYIVRNHADRQDLVHNYMQFLHDIFKSDESLSFLALGYITGILPIKKIKDESALNNFIELTMISSQPITQFYGFTEDNVRYLCDKYNANFETIEKWYNGYLIDGIHMYNPNSVSSAMLRNKIDSYWRNTSAFSTINNYISLNMDGLKDDVVKMLAGERVSVNVDTFQNDLSIINSKDEALTALIHLGYLGYDARRKKAFIPNYEVSTAFHAAIQTGKWHDLAKSLSNADSLLFDTIDGLESSVASKIDDAHEAYTSILQYNNENSLSCVVTMAYATAPAYYNIERELPTGKGFADLVFIPRKDTIDMPAMIIELKYNHSADTAIRQIKDNRYEGKLTGYADKIILVGINYDKKTKKHDCKIEVYVGGEI